MSTVRMAVVLSGLFAAAVAGPASAQKLAPTGITATAVAKVEVSGVPAVSTLSCGKAFSLSHTIKNLGAALSTKVVLNGVDTAFSLAKDETKTVVANGGTYDCSKPLAVKASIPAPALSGATITTSLYTRTYTPASVKFQELKTNTPDGDPIYFNANVANCGAPASVYVKFPAAASKSITVSVMVGAEKIGNVTLTGGTAKTVTFTTPLDCNSPLVLKAIAGGEWRTFTAESVTFKP